jgi:glycosyltransferase involved in cell wall biosynthesis
VKTVLLIAYHFPPIGGAGVQRSAKFARYLPEFGYRPVVITGPGPRELRWTPADASLLGELPADLTVLRIDGPEPRESNRLRARAERLLRVPSPFAKWWVDGVVAAGIEAAQSSDVIYASMSPFESAVAAARLARKTGRPWVADLRDPWALDEMQIFPSRFHRTLEIRRMRRLLESATEIVANTTEARRQLQRQIPGLGAKKITVIPNGYDAADFSGITPTSDQDRIRIVHAGYLHTELGTSVRQRSRIQRLLGGAVPGVDVLARSHVHLLDALTKLTTSRPDLARRVELHLAGQLSDHDTEVVRGNPMVRIHGFMPHRDSVALMQSADLLFLPMHGLPPGSRATIVPGKTYEYLASKRPIVATVPEGDARDLLSAAEGVLFAPPGDGRRLAEVLATGMDRLEQLREEASLRSPEFLARFERRQLTATLATVLDSAAALRAVDEPAVAEAEVG